jgi:hypothetical protein
LLLRLATEDACPGGVIRLIATLILALDLPIPNDTLGVSVSGNGGGG